MFGRQISITTVLVASLLLGATALPVTPAIEVRTAAVGDAGSPADAEARDISLPGVLPTGPDSNCHDGMLRNGNCAPPADSVVIFER
ncbi:MAG: hypothetical protein M1817_002199 [Caeruleum heppii]|nr:MAG: hypothetical protein M1817_002199 [Caeruleum heppii]